MKFMFLTDVNDGQFKKKCMCYLLKNKINRYDSIENW